MSNLDDAGERAQDETLLRSRGWNWLARFADQGLTAETLPLFEAWSGAALPAAQTDLDGAALHVRVFGIEVPATRGHFLATMHGAPSPLPPEIIGAAAAVGFAPRHDLAPDSLPALLDLLSLLCAASAAVKVQDPHEALLDQTRAVLGNGFLSWLPPLVEALSRCPAPYDAYAGLLAAFAADHAAALATEAPPLPEHPAPDVSSLGLGAVVSHLLAPGGVGCLIERSTLLSLGRQLELPVGFGDRRALLEALLRSAGEYGGVAGLLDGLGERFREAAAFYRTLAHDWAPLRPGADSWRRQAMGGVDFLEQMRDVASEGF